MGIALQLRGPPEGKASTVVATAETLSEKEAGTTKAEGAEHRLRLGGLGDLPGQKDVSVVPSHVYFLKSDLQTLDGQDDCRG